jgi:putative DNA primase/helicase
MSSEILAEVAAHEQQDFDENSSQARQKEVIENFKKNSLPKGFSFDGDGLWFVPEVINDGDPSSRIYISSRLDVVAISRDHQNENYGRLLEFYDVDGCKHAWAMPMELLASDGAEYRRELLSQGLRIAPGSKPRQFLTQYIQLCQPVSRVRCVLQTGWFRDFYVFPNETIGSNSNEKVLYQSFSNNHFGYGSKGVFEEWQKISQFCRGNSRLTFAVCVAFASPLLYLLGEEGGGFHFRGQSSTGKTTVTKVASSVWGGSDFLQSWRATSNGLEGMAAVHNDSLLCLDEIEEVSASEIGGIAYMLSNGIGKTRSDRYGIAKKKASWRLLFLSTGEISLSDHMQQVGKKVRAGQEVRCLDIPADTGRFGVFENLHGFESGDVFSKYLCKMSQDHFGHASREFLKKVVGQKDEALSYVKDVMAALQAKHLPKNSSGQVSRAFGRFVLVAAAGELATSYGITGWEIGEAADLVMICFNDWLKSRGGMGMHEETAAISQVRKFFELHGSSRFASIQLESDSKTINRAGFKKHTDQGVEYLVLREVFKNEVCVGFDPVFVAKVCIQHGLLISDSDGKATRPERIPALSEKGTTRVYRFSSKVLTDDIGVTGETCVSS